MALQFVSNGDIFSYPDLNIRVNPVNCVGVMGAGLAKEFKKRYPEMMTAYTKMCVFYSISPGSVHECLAHDGSIIILFATKDDWRDNSKYEYIANGLYDLRKIILKKYNNDNYFIGIPALGCGLGGLDWKEIKSMIQDNLYWLETNIIVFEPELPLIKSNKYIY